MEAKLNDLAASQPIPLDLVEIVPCDPAALERVANLGLPGLAGCRVQPLCPRSDGDLVEVIEAPRISVGVVNVEPYVERAACSGLHPPDGTADVLVGPERAYDGRVALWVDDAVCTRS